MPDFLKEEWLREVTIRIPKIEEAEIIRDLIIAAYSPIEPILGRKPRGMLETTEKVIDRIQKNTVYVVIYKDEIIGTFTMRTNKNHDLLEVQKVAVREDMQNKGLGSYIMESAEHMARELEERKIIIETYEDHKQLVDFYLHRGYKVIKDRIRKGNVVLLMEKKLWRED
ncbi:MAG: GNAT family N-acetyltransferase [Asgard group archaeon]|nr:GNAT family N-acetyltransferase [Asgard group archaeon]